MPIPDEWARFALAPRALTASEKYTVFLSYRSANRAWVLSLYDVLKRYGHKVFIDQVELAAGDELIPRLEQALRGSQAGVLVWSDASRDSSWVSKEYQTMERQATNREGFKFVPVRLDNTELPDFAQNRIFLDFHAYPDGPNGGELLRLLHAVVGKPLSEDAARYALDQAGAAPEHDVRMACVRGPGVQGRRKPDQTQGLPGSVDSARGDTEGVSQGDSAQAADGPRAQPPGTGWRLGPGRRRGAGDPRGALRARRT